MKLVPVTLFVFFFSVLKLHASDSLIVWSDLEFNNEPEEFAFKEFSKQNKENDLFLRLLLNTYYSTDGYSYTYAKERLTKSVEVIQQKTEGKSLSKKIKFTYDYLHKEYLKVYRLRNSFPDLLKDGEYNCVSGTALLAYVCRELNIPVTIKETPNHVFIIADPGGINMMLEVTTPDKGYNVYSPDFMEAYVKNLLKNKLVSQHEQDTSTAARIFNRYFFSSTGITCLELAALQYSNFCLYMEEDHKSGPAFNAIKKAYYLYPCLRHKFIIKSLLSTALNNTTFERYESIKKLQLFTRLKRTGDTEIENTVIENAFYRMLNVLLIEKPNKELLQNGFALISKEIKDATLKNNLAFEYYYELARLKLNHQEFEDSTFNYLSYAFRINPENENLKQLIKMGVSIQLRNGMINDGNFNSYITKYEETFPFLINDPLFARIHMLIILEEAYLSFYSGKANQGESKLKEFEKIASMQKEEVMELETFIEKTYAEAAVYYYKRGAMAKSKQFLKQGLLFIPGNRGLTERMHEF